MQLRKNYINNPNYRNKTKINVKGVLVHSTAGPPKYAADWSNYGMNGEVGMHAFLGLTHSGGVEVMQTLPWDQRGWHAGGSANSTHIGFEICEDVNYLKGTSTKEHLEKLYPTIVELCAYLLTMFDLTVSKETLITHVEASRKGWASDHGDVEHWWNKHGYSMDKLRSDVAAYMNKMTTETKNYIKNRKSSETMGGSASSTSGDNINVGDGSVSTGSTTAASASEVSTAVDMVITNTNIGSWDITVPEKTGSGRTSADEFVTDSMYQMLQTKKDFSALKTRLTNRVFAEPYRFTNATDDRPFAKSHGIEYGRRYLTNITTEAPIIQLVPGLPTYLPGMNDDERSYIQAFVKAQSSDDKDKLSSDAMGKVLGTDARYYGFIAAYSQYIRYVNILCRMAAIYMGIGDKTVPGTDKKYKTYDWGNWSHQSTYKEPEPETGLPWTEKANKVLTEFVNETFNDYKYLRFYVNSNVSFSESNSNSTGDSKVASLFDTITPYMKEIAFLSGGGNRLTSSVFDIGGSLLDTGSGILGSISDSMSENSLIETGSKLIGMASHVLTGSNVIFPEIWQSSDYSKSYSFSVDLVSPYGDKESIFLNIMVPMMHLISLAYPKQTSANSYASPFLVKAFAPGWFSTDMAMISSISITKGGDGGDWTVDGLPTVVKIDIDIKDLYQSMAIPPSSAPSLYFNNTSLMEHLAVTCGMDISQPALVTKLESMLQTYITSVTDIGTNIKNNVKDEIAKIISPYLKIGSF